MADVPAKDVFADDNDPMDEDEQRVIDEGEAAEEQEGTKTAASEAGSDDIEVVLAEQEKAEDEKEEGEVKQEGDADDGNLAAVESAEPADEDAELKTYSKKVQDRIERERRIVKRVREEAEVSVAGERAKRIDAERKSLAAHKNLTDVLLVNIEGQIKAKADELKRLLGGVDADGNAIENAAGKQVDVQGELDDLRVKRREIESAKTSLEQQSEEFERQVKVAPEAPKATPATQTWLGQNNWFGKKGFAAESNYTRQLDIQLASERSDKGSPAYFQELNRRIRAEMPDLADKVRRAFKPVVKTVGSAVAGVSRSAASVSTESAGKRRVTLTQEDLKNMREFKLDPTNKEHVAAYAREKLAAQ